MAMGRNLRVYHNLPNVGPNQSYSLLLENKARGEEYLLIENYAIVSLGELVAPILLRYVEICFWNSFSLVTGPSLSLSL